MNSEIIRIVVIEDEKDSRESLITRLNEEQDIEVVGSAASVDLAVMAIDAQKPDAIFLDIQIKGGDAYNLIDRLLRERIPVPAIILNTGFTQIEYAQKALNEYKEHILEIWLKPFYEGWEEKITKAKYFIRKQVQARHPVSSSIDSKLKIKSEGEILLLSIFEILYMEASGDIAKQRKSAIYLGKNDMHVVNKTLKQLHEEMSGKGFIQINRSQLINKVHISKYHIKEQTLYLNYPGMSFPVGNAFKAGLQEYFEGV